MDNINTDNSNNLNPGDEKLWKMARARAAFKRSLIVYAVVNIFLWLVWAVTGMRGGFYFPWPVFVTLGWGIGMFFNWYNVYYGWKDRMVLSEYEKLKNK
jgi:energy-coupling factor transporter transmembrane protein EcfT